MNSFNFTLSGKQFICPSILNDSFAGQSHLGCRSLPFMTWNTSSQPLRACKVSVEKSANSLMGTPLQVTISFSHAAFKILSLYLFFKFSKVFFIDYAITDFPIFFSPLSPLGSILPYIPAFPHPLVHVLGLYIQFFDFSISYTILNLSPSILCYQLCFLFPVPFSPFCPLPLTSDNPPCDLHFCDSVLFLFQQVAQFLFLFFFRFSC